MWLDRMVIILLLVPLALRRTDLAAGRCATLLELHAQGHLRQGLTARSFFLLVAPKNRCVPKTLKFGAPTSAAYAREPSAGIVSVKFFQVTAVGAAIGTY